MTVVLLHDLGDPAGGAQWRSAAPPDWIIPDLPGHGATPALRTGHHDPMAAVAISRWTLARGVDADADGESMLVGVGENAHPALVSAGAGDCDRVVVVDGLWGPWRTPAQQIDDYYAMLRAVAADPAATGPPPSSGLDPRAMYGYGVMSSAQFAQQFWGVIEQPVLAIETPRSNTPPGERAERAAWFAGGADIVELDATDPVSVVATIQAWR